MSDKQRDPSWDADPATPEQLQLVERVCNGLGFEGYFDTTCGWWRNEWNRPVFVPVVRSIALAYEFGRIDARPSDANEESDVPLPAGTNLYTHSAPTEVPADGYVTITTNDAGECVAVTRNDAEGRILRTLWKRFADTAPSAAQATRPAEHVDGVLQGEWVITGPDGSTFRGATPFRAALMANRHRVQTDPVAAKRFQGYVKADQALDCTSLYAQLCDLWQEANAVDTVIGRPEVLISKLAAIRDAVGRAVNGCIPQRAPAAEPVPYTRSPFKNGSQWVTFNIRAEHADRAARALDGARAACDACRGNSANNHFLDALASAADGEGSEL